MKTTIRLGTRGSVLARWQADAVHDALTKTGAHVEQIVIETTGDRRDGPLINLGAQGLFTKELQHALLAGEIDVAVHSLKDLPTEPVEGLVLAATLPRGPVHDVLVSARYSSLADLPPGAIIGTGSPRRELQLRLLHPDRFDVRNIRGNIATRLAKLDRGEYDAIVLAEAALERLGMSERIREYLEPPTFFPAVGQGAIGLEIRSGDTDTIAHIHFINHIPTFLAVSAERAMLRELGGGCSAPIAGLAVHDKRRPEKSLRLTGRVFSPSAPCSFGAECEANASVPSGAEELGVRVAQRLLENPEVREMLGNK